MSDFSSPAARIAAQLVDTVGAAAAHQAVDAICAKLTHVERAALAAHWPMWAREKQLAPPGDRWQSWGFLSGRGFGKTLAISKFVNEEVREGRAMLIGLAAQDEDNSIALQVLGPSGLVATSPPWFKPQWEATSKQLVWPNGARAYVRTPEVPGKIRGLEYHLSWICELQSWPKTTRDEAYMNFVVSTRLGYARVVWDATAKRRHPLLKELLANAEASPDLHKITRGKMHENPHLSASYKKKLDDKMGGTQQGREELEGEMGDDLEGAIVKEDWIEANRRTMPARLLRRVIAADPAVTARAGSDMTGIVDVGLAEDTKALVLGDYSGKHAPEAWATIILDKYFEGRCDLVIVETNKGGDLLTRNLRAAAKERGVSVVVIGKAERAPGHQPKVVHVREVFGRGEKADRAKPLATAYQKNRVCHVRGAELTALEETLTTWEPVPGAKSPDRLDPLVYAVGELLGYDDNLGDPAAGFAGIVALYSALDTGTGSRVRLQHLPTLLGGAGGGRI